MTDQPKDQIRLDDSSTETKEEVKKAPSDVHNKETPEVCDKSQKNESDDFTIFEKDIPKKPACRT